MGTTTVIRGLISGNTYTFTVAAENGIVRTGFGDDRTGHDRCAVRATGVRATKVAKGSVKVSFAAARDNGAADQDLHRDLRVVERRCDQDQERQVEPDHGHRPHRGQGLHVHRQGHQQSRHRTGVARIRSRQGVTAVPDSRQGQPEAPHVPPTSHEAPKVTARHTSDSSRRAVTRAPDGQRCPTQVLPSLSLFVLSGHVVLDHVTPVVQALDGDS